MQLFDPSTLNDLADFDWVPWDFGDNGCLIETDYSVASVAEGEEELAGTPLLAALD